MNIIFLFITWAKLQRSVLFSKLLPRFYVLPDKTSLSMSAHRLRLQLQSAALATDYNYGLHYKSAALSQKRLQITLQNRDSPPLLAHRSSLVTNCQPPPTERIMGLPPCRSAFPMPNSRSLSYLYPSLARQATSHEKG